MEVTAAIHYQHSTKQLEYAALAHGICWHREKGG